MRVFFAALTILGLTGTAQAQQFTTVEQVKPILDMTRANWIAVREYNGKDLVYFTHLATYRCALSEVRYGINTPVPVLIFLPEPCYRDEAVPFLQKPDSGVLPYVEFPAGSVQSVTVQLIYQDGSQDSAQFDRSGALIP